MSTTPPPTYSKTSLSDLKSALPEIKAEVTTRAEESATTPAVKSKKLRIDGWNDEKPEAVVIDEKNAQLIDVFNYTGMTFGETSSTYDNAAFLPSFPKLSYPALVEQPIDDRAFHADPKKSRFYKEVEAQGGEVIFLTPTIGVDVIGVSLKQLGKEARDDLALIIAERGVVFFRDQKDLDINSQLDLGRHFGPLHVHATTGVPKQEGLEEVHVVYADQGARPDPTGFRKDELFHSDVTYEIQPPGPTILKLITAPTIGGDTLFTSGAAVYSSFSPAYQKYLESLYAVHSAKEQTDGALAAGTHVRRAAVETIHPVVRVNPVTGMKSVFVNAGFTRRIVGVPKGESDNTLRFLNEAFAMNGDFSVRIKWKRDDVAIWHNGTVNHSALFDFWPERRHGVRVTPHAEKPLSVEEYESKYQQPAKDWLTEKYKGLGLEKPKLGGGLDKKARGFKD